MCLTPTLWFEEANWPNPLLWGLLSGLMISAPQLSDISKSGKQANENGLVSELVDTIQGICVAML